MKKLLVIGIIILLVGVSIPSTGINVEKSNITSYDGNTLYVGGSGPGNYTKIQDAIDIEEGLLSNTHIAYTFFSYEYYSELYKFELPNFDNFTCRCPNVSFLSNGITWCHLNESIYTIEDNSNITVLNPETCVAILLGDSGMVEIMDLSFEPNSEILYGNGGTDFYQINMKNGSVSLIGSMGTGTLMVSIDCDRRGNMYGVDLGFGTTSLYSINTSNGHATKIGNLGISLNYGQHLSYDKDYDILYIITFNYGTFQPELYIINVTNGDASYIGRPPSGLIEFTIPYYYIWNQPPNPPTINGTLRGREGLKYNYTVRGVDPDGDNIWYHICWGDKEIIYIHGPYPSGEALTLSYNWTQKGTYIIQCKTSDEYGKESNWTYFEVTMPKSHYWLMNWFNKFPLLHRLLEVLIR